MKIFITATDTNVGKTVISSWIALHTGFAYFKPIQTGLSEGSDSREVQRLAGAKIYSEIYAYREPLSPHLAAKIENDKIDMNKIILPEENNLIIEGAGGVLVPVNDQYFMIDLIKKLKLPVILVSRTNLGTINHTLLSLEALKARDITVLGIIMNGEQNIQNADALCFYGQVPILAEFPNLKILNKKSIAEISLPHKLKQILRIN